MLGEFSNDFEDEQSHARREKAPVAFYLREPVTDGLGKYILPKGDLAG
jgi:hypothetical protein